MTWIRTTVSSERTTRCFDSTLRLPTLHRFSPLTPEVPIQMLSSLLQERIGSDHSPPTRPYLPSTALSSLIRWFSEVHSLIHSWSRLVSSRVGEPENDIPQLISIFLCRYFFFLFTNSCLWHKSCTLHYQISVTWQWPAITAVFCIYNYTYLLLALYIVWNAVNVKCKMCFQLCIKQTLEHDTLTHSLHTQIHRNECQGHQKGF